jgi:hypothetical protein
MLIKGCDFHTRYQQIAMAREETSGLPVERRLDHESGEVQAFYRGLQSLQESVRVDRGHRTDSLVRAFACGTRSRTVDRRLRKDSRQ